MRVRKVTIGFFFWFYCCHDSAEEMTRVIYKEGRAEINRKEKENTHIKREWKRSAGVNSCNLAWCSLEKEGKRERISHVPFSRVTKWCRPCVCVCVYTYAYSCWATFRPEPLTRWPGQMLYSKNLFRDFVNDGWSSISRLSVSIKIQPLLNCVHLTRPLIAVYNRNPSSNLPEWMKSLKGS